MVLKQNFPAELSTPKIIMKVIKGALYGLMVVAILVNILGEAPWIWHL